ncbi:MAG: MMPL family transporter, partial [Candidatus Thermoplasmatota archaeon]|nr:MMPL family transporter [Candidatus Thermoplasmatota archaeon]
MTEGTSSSEALERLFEKSSLTIVVVSVLFTAAMMQVLMGFPGFTTEISSFAPESDSDSSESRINEEMGAAPHLLYIDVRPYSESADGGNACDDSPCNVLELGALQQLAVDLERIEQYSNDNGDFILSHLNTAGIIQTALDERDEQARNLSEFSDWVELLDAVSNGEECSDAIGNDQAIASASFAASAMLHSDFDYDPVCEWLDTGEGNPSPVASSTMWVIEISGEISNEDRRDLSAGIRDLLSDGDVLNYGVISDDLISHDINQSTMDNLVWLLLIAVLVVVALLALAFRSFMMVAAPLMGLSAALVWTYGIVTLLGMRLSVLEVAVAPVVLGLGIDYSIHLQRAYESAKNRSGSAAQAWVESISVLRLALSLAVVTTVFAFLANTFSELPPLRTFGFTLALGVVSAF